MAQHKSVPCGPTNQRAYAERCRVYIPHLHLNAQHQPTPVTHDVPWRNEDHPSRRSEPASSQLHSSPPCHGRRRGIPRSLNHREHRRAERVNNPFPLRHGYSAAGPRRKRGPEKDVPVSPDYVRPSRNTAPTRARCFFSVKYECCWCGDGTSIKRTAHKPDRAGRCDTCQHRWCPKCPREREEWVDKVLEKGKKGGKRDMIKANEGVVIRVLAWIPNREVLEYK
jgi:hypothetical protein